MSAPSPWYAVALSADVRKRPVGIQVEGHRVVLYRTASGTLVALEDRCPHRNVALSLGRVEGDTVRCAYHGWRFSPQGACVEAPCSLPHEELPARGPPVYPVHERGGLIFVCLADAAEPSAMFSGAGVEGASYATALLRTRVNCSADMALDNFVDCGHTGFVHAGIFRGYPEHAVEAEIQENDAGVLIETRETGGQDSLLWRMLAGGQPLRHTDALLLPSAIKVDYTLGANRHVQTISYCTPTSDDTTDIFTRLAVRFGAASQAILQALRLSTRAILAQDKRILDNLGAQLRHYKKPRFSWVDADEPCLWVARARKAYLEGRWEGAPRRSAKIRYKL